MIGPSHNLLPYTSFAAPGHRRGALSLTRGYEAEVVRFGEPAADSSSCDCSCWNPSSGAMNCDLIPAQVPASSMTQELD